MKVTIKGFIHYRKDDWCVFNDYQIYPYESSHSGAVCVCPVSVEVEIPDDFNPITAQVAALENEKRVIKAVFAKNLMALEDSISKLTCITNEVRA